MNQRGFTLLEIVIAVTILAFLSLFTVQSIQQALKAKLKIEKNLDKSSTMRDALRTMERDINLAFNYRDPSIKLYNMMQEARKKAATEKKPGGTAGIGTAKVETTSPFKLGELKFERPFAGKFDGAMTFDPSQL